MEELMGAGQCVSFIMSDPKNACMSLYEHVWYHIAEQHCKVQIIPELQLLSG